MSGDQEFTQSDDEATLRALRDSEARFRTLAASTPTAIFECDLTGEVLYANERWSDLLGAEIPAEATLVDRLHPEDLKWLTALWEADMSASEPKGFEARCRMVKPRGPWCWYDVSLRPMFDSDGRIRSYLGAIHDVTELVEARQRSQRFQSIVEATSDLVAIVRDDLDIQYLNPAGRDAVGLGPDDDTTRLDPSRHFPDDEWPRVVDEASRLLDDQPLWNVETSFRQRGRDRHHPLPRHRPRHRRRRHQLVRQPGPGHLGGKGAPPRPRERHTAPTRSPGC